MVKNPFKVNVYTLDKLNTLHLINFEKIDADLEKYFDSIIGDICEGNGGGNIKLVKLRLLNFFASKAGSTIEIGAIAEFVCHSYIKTLGYRQEFLFENLEEGSIKKGFDGYYTKLSVPYIFESKSGLHTTASISHKNKIKEAYGDLEKKLVGGGSNDPWRNAYNHAAHADVGSDKKIQNALKTLSEDYIQGYFFGIDNFHVIPGSTIFYENNWISIDELSHQADFFDLIQGLKAKSNNIICINKCSKKEFLDYLGR